MIFTVKKENVGKSLAEFCETHTAEQIQAIWEMNNTLEHSRVGICTTTGNFSIISGESIFHVNARRMGWSFTTTEHHVTEADVWEGAVSETITLHIK